MFNAGMKTDFPLIDEKMRELYLESLVRILSLRDFETKEHTQRVITMALDLACAMDVPESDLVHIYRGAMLHDIGKIGIPDSILHKNGTLTHEERKIMSMHPIYAYELLQPIPCLGPALDIPYCHHEKWDGTGYPRGLKGKQIPFAARLFAVVDVWDALLSDRPYRPAWAKEQAIEYLQNQSGSHFEPYVVEVFLEKMILPNLAACKGKVGGLQYPDRIAFRVTEVPPQDTVTDV